MERKYVDDKLYYREKRILNSTIKLKEAEVTQKQLTTVLLESLVTIEKKKKGAA